MGGSVSNFPSGTDKSYAVIKHRLPTGGLMIRCTRCGEEWQPINIDELTPASPGWEEAINFETINVTSESGIYGRAVKLAAIHKQIEHWTAASVAWTREQNRLLREISKKDEELLAYRPKKFTDRFKIALQIIRGN